MKNKSSKPLYCNIFKYKRQGQVLGIIYLKNYYFATAKPKSRHCNEAEITKLDNLNGVAIAKFKC